MAPFDQRADHLDSSTYADTLAAGAPAQSLSVVQASRGHCLVVVPTYNEALNIERLVIEVLGQGSQFDVLVVDDGSPDGTGDLVAAMAAQTSRVQLIRRAGKLGLGSAYVAGFREGLRQGYRYLCEMDADFSHQPRYLPVLLAVAERAADVALGSRNVPGSRVENWSWVRKLISKGGSPQEVPLSTGFKGSRA